METSGIRDWGDAVWTSITGAMTMLLAAVPKIIGFLVILTIGFAVAAILARGVRGLLHVVKFDGLAQRAGLTELGRKMGIRSDPSTFIAGLARWFVRLITLVVAFDALGLPAVSNVLHQLLMWLPNLAVALVILVVAGLAANAVSGLVRGATAKAGFTNPNVLATIVRFAVLTFGVLVAVTQVGIATELVNILFMALVGAVALALGLSFGLGGRDVAAQIVSGWHQTARRAGPALRAQIDEAYARTHLEFEGTPPGGWTGGERRRGYDPNYRGIERRRGMA